MAKRKTRENHNEFRITDHDGSVAELITTLQGWEAKHPGLLIDFIYIGDGGYDSEIYLERLETDDEETEREAIEASDDRRREERERAQLAHLKAKYGK